MTQPTLTEDEYLAWRALPVTEVVLRALMNCSQRLEAQVKAEMWEAECLSPEVQCRLSVNKGRSRAWAEAASLDFSALSEIMELESE